MRTRPAANWVALICPSLSPHPDVWHPGQFQPQEWLFPTPNLYHILCSNCRTYLRTPCKGKCGALNSTLLVKLKMPVRRYHVRISPGVNWSIWILLRRRSDLPFSRFRAAQHESRKDRPFLLNWRFECLVHLFKVSASFLYHGPIQFCVHTLLSSYSVLIHRHFRTRTHLSTYTIVLYSTNRISHFRRGPFPSADPAEPNSVAQSQVPQVIGVRGRYCLGVTSSTTHP